MGQVALIRFDPDNYQADVELTVPKNISLQEDAIASVRSTGIIGGKFVKITPGGSEKLLVAGDEMFETERQLVWKKFYRDIFSTVPKMPPAKPNKNYRSFR